MCKWTTREFRFDFKSCKFMSEFCFFFFVCLVPVCKKLWPIAASGDFKITLETAGYFGALVSMYAIFISYFSRTGLFFSQLDILLQAIIATLQNHLFLSSLAGRLLARLCLGDCTYIIIINNCAIFFMKKQQYRCFAFCNWFCGTASIMSSLSMAHFSTLCLAEKGEKISFHSFFMKCL